MLYQVCGRVMSETMHPVKLDSSTVSLSSTTKSLSDALFCVLYLLSMNILFEECFKLKMTDKEKQETTYFIDPSTYYIIKETTKTTVNGKEVEGSTIMSNYKKQDCGIVYPFTVAGPWGEMEVATLEINPKVDESIFKVAK
jgi:hypothetical protein